MRGKAAEMQVKEEGSGWAPGLEMKPRSKAVAEADADAGALAECENPCPCLVWSVTQG